MREEEKPQSYRAPGKVLKDLPIKKEKYMKLDDDITGPIALVSGLAALGSLIPLVYHIQWAGQLAHLNVVVACAVIFTFLSGVFFWSLKSMSMSRKK